MGIFAKHTSSQGSWERLCLGANESTASWERGRPARKQTVAAPQPPNAGETPAFPGYPRPRDAPFHRSACDEVCLAKILTAHMPLRGTERIAAPGGRQGAEGRMRRCGPVLAAGRFRRAFSRAPSR